MYAFDNAAPQVRSRLSYLADSFHDATRCFLEAPRTASRHDAYTLAAFSIPLFLVRSFYTNFGLYSRC